MTTKAPKKRPLSLHIVYMQCFQSTNFQAHEWRPLTELWGGSTCGSPAVLPWSAHYMELWASPLLSFLSFVFTAMSSRDIIALAIVDMFSRKTAILLTRSLLARIHLVPLKGPIQSRDSNIASAYCSLRLYISSPHWQQEGKTVVTQFSPFRVSWLRKRLQTTHSEQTAASWYKVKSRKEAATNLGGARRPQPGNLVVGLPLLDYELPDIATNFHGRNISGVATILVYVVWQHQFISCTQQWCSRIRQLDKNKTSPS